MLVGITDLNEEKIYLYKDNGELVKGFPIKGNSVIDIKDSDNEVKLTLVDNFKLVFNAKINFEAN